MSRFVALMAAAVLLSPGAAAAQSAWTIDVGAAGRMRPDHLGSARYVGDVVPIVEATYGERVRISYDDGAKWSALRWRNLQAGPVVEYRQSFDEGLPSGTFRMRDAVEAGGFAKAHTPIGVAEARLRHAIGGYDGWSADLMFNSGAQMTRSLSLAGQLRLSWADARFTREYFHEGPSAAGPAAPSPNQDYVTAGAEIDAIGEITPKSRLVLALSEDRIVGELRPSPLFVNRNIFTASLGMTYRWSAANPRTPK